MIQLALTVAAGLFLLWAGFWAFCIIFVAAIKTGEAITGREP